MTSNVRVQFLRTDTAGKTPNVSDPSNTAFIANGEFAINFHDKVIYTTNNGIDIITIGAAGGGIGTDVIYVAKNGSDTGGDGSMSNPFLTIKKASIVANTLPYQQYCCINVMPGEYEEECPITLPTYTSIIGSLRGVKVKPKYRLDPLTNAPVDMFYLHNATYVNEITVADYDGKAFSFPPTGAGPIYRSPYVFNCTSITTSSTASALTIDGSLAQPNSTITTSNRSIIAGLYTIINQGGYGVKLINRGYSQLVNIYTLATYVGVYTESGGFCTLNCSDSSFGDWGMISNGVSGALRSGYTQDDQVFGNEIVIKNVIEPGFGGTAKIPFINNAMLFKYPNSAPIFTYLNPTTYEIKYKQAIAAGNTFSAANTYATTQATEPKYFTVIGIQPLVNTSSYPYTPTTNPNEETGFVKITTLETITTPIPINTAVTFHQRSQISAAGHAFEYVGSGTNLQAAIPFNGGISNTTMQTYAINGGFVNYTSTDQFGNFNINSNLRINGITATIEGDAFQRSLFGLMTPYILAIEGGGF
jgi:hypothetical protein